MITRLHLLPLVSLVAVGAVMLPAHDARMKCGRLAPSGVPIFALDGVIKEYNRAPAFGLEAKDIDRIDVLCMDPVDSTFNRTSGWQTISIWTRQGPAPRVQEALVLIRDAQDAHFKEHGKYTPTLAAIPLPESFKPLRITLQADAKGWVARATVPRLLQTCTMYDGVVAAPLAIGPRHSVCSGSVDVK